MPIDLERFRGRPCSICLAVLLLFCTTSVIAGKPAVENLGDGRYQMGEIVIDKPGRAFTVPGRVIFDASNPLMEYLVVKKGGMKSYEAVFELDTTATAFNVACILIGLDAARATLPEYHFDPKPVNGDRVEVILEWHRGDATKRLPVGDLILEDGKRLTGSEWVYTGSTILPDRRYLAEESGTLVGIVHDRDSIIEHRAGVGLNGAHKVELDTTLLPPRGTPVRLTIRNITETPEQDKP